MALYSYGPMKASVPASTALARRRTYTAWIEALMERADASVTLWDVAASPANTYATTVLGHLTRGPTLETTEQAAAAARALRLCLG